MRHLAKVGMNGCCVFHTLDSFRHLDFEMLLVDAIKLLLYLIWHKSGTGCQMGHPGQSARLGVDWEKICEATVCYNPHTLCKILKCKD